MRPVAWAVVISKARGQVAVLLLVLATFAALLASIRGVAIDDIAPGLPTVTPAAAAIGPRRPVPLAIDWASMGIALGGFDVIILVVANSGIREVFSIRRLRDHEETVLHAATT